VDPYQDSTLSPGEEEAEGHSQQHDDEGGDDGEQEDGDDDDGGLERDNHGDESQEDEL
jgi:hypothetical protein